jgi:tripartite-type tricarboxylate transporter receptor subunit TctC
MTFRKKTARKKTAVAVLGLALAGASAAALPAGANDIAEHYKGKTITILVPYGPGGTYDKYAQLFTRHLEQYIPGKPNIIVQHMPGAGGAKGMNYAYNVMPKEGYNMITPLDNTVVNQLLRPKKMRYDAKNFTWLGSSNQTNVILVVSTRKGVMSMEDWAKSGTEMIGSSSGVASTSTLIPRYAMTALGLKGRVVAGYKGSRNSILAVEKGEASSRTGSRATSRSARPSSRSAPSGTPPCPTSRCWRISSTRNGRPAPNSSARWVRSAAVSPCRRVFRK